MNKIVCVFNFDQEAAALPQVFRWPELRYSGVSLGTHYL